MEPNLRERVLLPDLIPLVKYFRWNISLSVILTSVPTCSYPSEAKLGRKLSQKTEPEQIMKRCCMQINLNAVNKSFTYTVSGVSLIQAEVYCALSWCTTPLIEV